MTGSRRMWMAILLLGAAAAWFYYRGAVRPAPGGTVPVRELAAVEPGCEPVGRTCVVSGGGVRVHLRLGAGLRPLVSFPVVLTLSGVSPGAVKEVRIAFTMAGMDMGRNVYRLLPVGGGAWSGRAMLPVCSTGRRDWLATVSVEKEKGRWVARFPFTAGR